MTGSPARLAALPQTARVESPATSCGASASSPAPNSALERELTAAIAALRPGCSPNRRRRDHRGDADRPHRRRRALPADGHFARQAGAAPIPVSSGRRDRVRLNRGGDRQLNCALHRIAVTQARTDPGPRAYLARKQAEGKTRPRPTAASSATSPAASGSSCSHHPDLAPSDRPPATDKRAS